MIVLLIRQKFLDSPRGRARTMPREVGTHATLLCRPANVLQGVTPSNRSFLRWHGDKQPRGTDEVGTDKPTSGKQTYQEKRRSGEQSFRGCKRLTRQGAKDARNRKRRETTRVKR